MLLPQRWGRPSFGSKNIHTLEIFLRNINVYQVICLISSKLKLDRHDDLLCIVMTVGKGREAKSLQPAIEGIVK